MVGYKDGKSGREMDDREVNKRRLENSHVNQPLTLIASGISSSGRFPKMRGKIEKRKESQKERKCEL